MTWSMFHKNRGATNLIALKRGYDLRGDGLSLLSEAPAIIEKAEIVDDVLETECDIQPKPHYTDVVLQGSVHAPPGREVTRLDAGISINGAARIIRAIGQRRLRVGRKGLSFTDPEPFRSIPLSWREAYGGNDILNAELGDPWDIPKMAEATNQDLSAMNLCIYRRNPVGKGFVLRALPEHDGLELPRLELAHHLLTPENLVVGDPRRWYFQPSPAHFGWLFIGWYPRICFSLVKLFKGTEEVVPPGRLPEEDFGITRGELYDPVDPRAFAQQPRVLNAAHPAMQLPTLRGKQTIELRHLLPDHPSRTFVYEAKPPVVHLRTPGDHRAYKQNGFLSQLVFDLEKREMHATWHVMIRTHIPALSEEAREEISVDVDW